MVSILSSDENLFPVLKYMSRLVYGLELLLALKTA